jgi:hypothetical protein
VQKSVFGEPLRSQILHLVTARRQGKDGKLLSKIAHARKPGAWQYLAAEQARAQKCCVWCVCVCVVIRFISIRANLLDVSVRALGSETAFA